MSTTPEAKTRPNYLPELDALRFVAFCLIFIYHIVNKTPRSGSTWDGIRVAAELSLRYGVSLFFLLSAYLITTLLEKEVEEKGELHIKAFYIRRTARIWPLYFFYLFVCWVAGHFIPGWRLSTGTILSFIFLSGNWWLAAGHELGGPLITMWSVNVEEQFYLFAPQAVKHFKRAGLIGLSIAAFLAAYGMLLWEGFSAVRSETAIRFNSLVEMQFFAAGTVLALLLKTRPWRVSSLGRVALLAVGATTWVASVYGFDVNVGMLRVWSLAPAIHYAFVLLGCICFFLAFLGATVRPAMRPFVWLGKISYGLYVYHAFILNTLTIVWPQHTETLNGKLIQILSLLITFGATILIAWLSYTWLEKPFLRLKKRFTYVPSRPI